VLFFFLSCPKARFSTAFRNLESESQSLPPLFWFLSLVSSFFSACSSIKHSPAGYPEDVFFFLVFSLPGHFFNTSLFLPMSLLFLPPLCVIRFPALFPPPHCMPFQFWPSSLHYSPSQPDSFSLFKPFLPFLFFCLSTRSFSSAIIRFIFLVAIPSPFSRFLSLLF